ncbi:hypothetical protein PR048_001523 [Dryococelus australis]|uniref:Uncharacterized protein n=1 Tax=Dryococelus australis TaxID=614101 RepID=A0ABQ9IHL3_9NEOP|nr:hypothetical protein PR048_001523 [Dryococelus australis]
MVLLKSLPLRISLSQSASSYGNASNEHLNRLQNTSQLSNSLLPRGIFWTKHSEIDRFSNMLLEQMVRLLLYEFEEPKFAEAIKIVMDMDAVAKSAALMSGA